MSYKIENQGWHNRDIVSSIGLRGGLWLLWSNIIRVNILYCDEFIIHMRVNNNIEPDPILLMFILAPSKMEKITQFGSFILSLDYGNPP